MFEDSGGPLNSITRGAFLPLAFVLYLVAANSRRTVAAYGLVASLAVMAFQALVLHLNGLGSGNADVAGLVLIVCWTVGYSVQQRRAYAAFDCSTCWCLKMNA